MLRKLLFPLTLAVSLICGSALAAPSPMPATFTRHVLASISRGPLMPDCVPRRLDADPSVARQGAVFFVHGMTACPQQFFELGPLLQKLGYDVYLFLLPGHGRLDQPGRRGFLDMPRSREWDRYLDLARLINQVASEMEGQKILGGFSLGGGIALASVALEPNLYDRLVLFAPYVHQHFELAQKLGFPLVRRVPAVGELWGKWASQCKNPGRQGYCYMKLDQILALENLGQWIEENLTGRGRTEIQLIGGAKDFSASNRKALQVLQDSGFAYSACQIAGAPHSFFARMDNLDLPMPWMPDFNQRVPEFITRGIPWPRRHSSLAPAGVLEECRLGNRMDSWPGLTSSGSVGPGSG